MSFSTPALDLLQGAAIGGGLGAAYNAFRRGYTPWGFQYRGPRMPALATRTRGGGSFRPPSGMTFTRRRRYRRRRGGGGGGGGGGPPYGRKYKRYSNRRRTRRYRGLNKVKARLFNKSRTVIPRAIAPQLATFRVNGILYEAPASAGGFILPRYLASETAAGEINEVPNSIHMIAVPYFCGFHGNATASNQPIFRYGGTLVTANDASTFTANRLPRNWDMANSYQQVRCEWIKYKFTIYDDRINNFTEPTQLTNRVEVRKMTLRDPWRDATGGADYCSGTNNAEQFDHTFYLPTASNKQLRSYYIKHRKFQEVSTGTFEMISGVKKYTVTVFIKDPYKKARKMFQSSTGDTNLEGISPDGFVDKDVYKSTPSFTGDTRDVPHQCIVWRTSKTPQNGDSALLSGGIYVARVSMEAQFTGRGLTMGQRGWQD